MKILPFKIDGMELGPEEIKQHREMLIILRDAALKANNFEYAVGLSHIIAILAILIQRMEA